MSGAPYALYDSPGMEHGTLHKVYDMGDAWEYVCITGELTHV
jgi:hypothetical protein